ncbi:hypothetical protein IWW36_001027 [Coemansia brasiliensis]|uniref:SWI/SNF and RSC complexes subunit Ssr4 C-terminal domain-containing protein n=1 Tax=Coemansia brasiliensis TaxID=2650707 RepID=A0A9W8IIJ6_9FUNG|nr:hypothetical protein IWW36_001027 [Coemansia brasiliensis]
MSGPQQTPIRYAPNQQYIARPGQMLGTPPSAQHQQRPMMQYRPNMAMQTPNQAMMNRGMGSVTPQQQQQLQQQQQYMQQQQMMRPNMMQGQMRPNMQQPFAYTGNTSMAVAGVGVNGQQAHPALIQQQQQQQRKRKGKTGDGADEGVTVGDELDSIQPYNISMARYQNNHNLMSEIFVALPTSTIDVPKHYYEDMSSESLENTISGLTEQVAESKKEHGEKLDRMQKGREEFAELMHMLRENNADEVKKVAKERFDMEFVDNPYSTVERVPIDKVEAVESPIYKQL